MNTLSEKSPTLDAGPGSFRFSGRRRLPGAVLIRGVSRAEPVSATADNGHRSRPPTPVNLAGCCPTSTGILATGPPSRCNSVSAISATGVASDCRADRVALRVTVGGQFEWTDAGRQDFAENPPQAIQVEVTITGRRTATSVFEYRQPGSLVDRITP